MAPAHRRSLPKAARCKAQHGDHKFKTELIEFKLLTNESVAYKARLKQSRVIIYSWTMDDGKFHYGYHAEPDKGPKGYWVRYKAADGEMSDQGVVGCPILRSARLVFPQYGQDPTDYQVGDRWFLQWYRQAWPLISRQIGTHRLEMEG